MLQRTVGPRRHPSASWPLLIYSFTTFLLFSFSHVSTFTPFRPWFVLLFSRCPCFPLSMFCFPFFIFLPLFCHSRILAFSLALALAFAFPASVFHEACDAWLNKAQRSCSAGVASLVFLLRSHMLLALQSSKVRRLGVDAAPFAGEEPRLEYHNFV